MLTDRSDRPTSVKLSDGAIRGVSNATVGIIPADKLSYFKMATSTNLGDDTD